MPGISAVSPPIKEILLNLQPLVIPFNTSYAIVLLSLLVG